MRLEVTLRGETTAITALFEESELEHFATEVLPKLKHLFSLLERQPVLVFFNQSGKEGTAVQVPTHRITSTTNERDKKNKMNRDKTRNTRIISKRTRTSL